MNKLTRVVSLKGCVLAQLALEEPAVLLNGMAAAPDFQSVIIKHNRETLPTRTLPKYQFNVEHNITRTSFHNDQNVSIQHIHSPERCGDKIHRFTNISIESGRRFYNAPELKAADAMSMRRVLEMLPVMRRAWSAP